MATLLFDTGMRPDELHRMRWEDITWANGRNGTILVTKGKTKAARRLIPMTPRVPALLDSRWNIQGHAQRDGSGPRQRRRATSTSPA